jgi:hypothetical protein
VPKAALAVHSRISFARRSLLVSGVSALGNHALHASGPKSLHEGEPLQPVRLREGAERKPVEDPERTR